MAHVQRVLCTFCFPLCCSTVLTAPACGMPCNKVTMLTEAHLRQITRCNADLLHEH